MHSHYNKYKLTPSVFPFQLRACSLTTCSFKVSFQIGCFACKLGFIACFGEACFTCHHYTLAHATLSLDHKVYKVFEYMTASL